MTLYRLDVLGPPNERLRHRREFEAGDDTEAVRCADELYAEFAVGATLDRYVLYEGGRVVHEELTDDGKNKAAEGATKKRGPYKKDISN